MSEPKTCIITSTNRRGSCDSTSVMVHCRNALTLRNELGFDLIEGEADVFKLDQRYDNIICNYASFYMPWKAYFDRIMAQPDARLWWMVNDHDVEDNILLREILKATNCERTYGVISNNSREGFRQWILRKWIQNPSHRLNNCIDEWHTVNLNSLTYEDRSDLLPVDDLIPDRFKAIYWGSWRKWRLPYFKKYCSRDIYFSTSKKNRLKLIANGCRFSFLNPIRWGDSGTLLKANATVYLEDPHTHQNFAFPANRFYEALSYGVNILIDESCRRNAEQFGYENLQFVDSLDQFLEASKHKQPIPDQWKLRAKSERESALRQIQTIIKGGVALPTTRETPSREEIGDNAQLSFVYC